MRRAEAGKLAMALQWARLHPSLGGTQEADDAAVFFSPYEVAMIGHAQELFHRLPGRWERVQSGAVPAWRARKVAEATIHAVPELSADAVAWIDAQTAPFLGTVGPAQIERIIEQAKLSYALAATDEGADDVVDQRHVHIQTRELSLDLGADGTLAART